VTPPVDDPETLRRILTNTHALLLDFDGPICNLFSGIPAPVVAQQLRDILAQGGHTHLPDNIRTATDPFDILRHAATLGPDEARYVEAAFTAHEVEAIHTAQPTPGAHNLIHAWKYIGRSLAIVSNNSKRAVDTYLALSNLRCCVDEVSARTSADISLLKPSSHLVAAAARNLSIPQSKCTLIGDSLTDVHAAGATGTAMIAYANKDGKVGYLATGRPDAVTTTISMLVVQVKGLRNS
jgi:beta-phosphoglucomutase-like phosphatase (HAD superfamily)